VSLEEYRIYQSTMTTRKECPIRRISHIYIEIEKEDGDSDKHEDLSTDL
jgi:hypothetical protein